MPHVYGAHAKTQKKKAREPDKKRVSGNCDTGTGPSGVWGHLVGRKLIKFFNGHGVFEGNVIKDDGALGVLVGYPHDGDQEHLAGEEAAQLVELRDRIANDHRISIGSLVESNSELLIELAQSSGGQPKPGSQARCRQCEEPGLKVAHIDGV